MGQIFLFLGPEIGQKNDAILQMRVEMEKKFGSLEFRSFFSSEDKLSDAISQLENSSLFGGATLVVMNGAESFKKKDDCTILESWKNEKSDNALILTSENWSIDAKIDKIVPQKNKRVFRELSEQGKAEFLRTFFKKEELEIDSDAIALILEMLENDTQSLRDECSRFKWCFQKGTHIGASDVEKILGHNREENAFTLFDAISKPTQNAQTRLENALLIAQKIQLTKNASPVLLIAGLASCFRKLALWHSLHAENPSIDDFNLKKYGFLGKSMCAQYARAAQIWNYSQCAAVCALLATRDLEMRSLGSALNATQISLLLYEIVVKNGNPILVYE